MKRLVLLVLGIAMLFLSENVGAAETPSSDAMDFSAQAIPSEFQKHNKKDLSYWWLDTSKQEAMTLYVEIANGKNENTFDISVHQAISNENLVIDYSLASKDSQKYLYGEPNFDFTQKVKIGESETDSILQVTLAAHETRRIPIKLDVSEKLKGQVIGGINVTRHAKEAERTGSILNVYNRAVALVLDAGVEEKSTALQFAPSNLEVSHQALTLINSDLRLISEASIKAEITDTAGEVVSELKEMKGAIVPQAKINLVMNNKKQLYEGEKYILKVSVRMSEEDENQTFEYSLTVAKDGTVTAEPIRKQPENNIPYFPIALAFLLTGLVSFIVFKKKKTKREENSKKIDDKNK